MNLFIDTEFNSFGGELMSIALIADNGNQFYRELYLPANIHPWVAEHVVPKFSSTPTSVDQIQRSLEAFLNQFDKVNIIADWPDDLRHLCQLLITGPGTRISFPPMTMQIVHLDGESANPHHALFDAIGLKHEYNRP